MKTKKIITVLICISTLLTGCWDRVELENRGFVNSIGIDIYDPTLDNSSGTSPITFTSGSALRYTISITLPNLSELSGSGSGEDTKNNTVKVAADETVNSAMRLIDSSSSQKLYFGNTQVAVLGEGILKDPKLFNEAVDALERNPEISKRTIILATNGRAVDVLASNVTGEPLLGMFVKNFYNNNSTTVAMAFRQDLEDLVHELRLSQDAVMSQSELLANKLKLGGAGVIKDYSLIGWLSDKETRGYLWFKGEAKGAQVATKFDGTYIPLNVNRTGSKISFDEGDGNINCYADIFAEGTVSEYMLNNTNLYNPNTLNSLEKSYSAVIQNEVVQTFNKFQKDFKVDGYMTIDELRKKNFDLYERYANDYESAFQNMKLIPKVTVKITNAGAIK